MSVHVMSWVLRHSEATLGDRLVLLVLADKAESDGTNAWPSVATIARETLLSERQVQYSLRRLEATGQIMRTGRHRTGDQRYGTHVYAVIMNGAESAPLDQPKGAISNTQRVQPTAPEPSLEPSLTTSAASPRPRNDLWDALAEIFGSPTTRTAETRRGKVVSSLRRAGATPEEVYARAKRWPLHFDTATMTDTALESHWDTLPRKPLRRTG